MEEQLSEITAMPAAALSSRPATSQCPRGRLIRNLDDIRKTVIKTQMELR
jgi:hypothetical protein